MPKNSDPCCNEKVRRTDEGDENFLEQDVHLPKFRPGKDHEKLDGYHNRGISEAKLKGSEFLSNNGSMHRIKIRYKPKEVIAYFVQSEHEEAEGSGKAMRKRKSGFLVPGPYKSVFYVPEDQFSKFFEIIEDEGRMIT